MGRMTHCSSTCKGNTDRLCLVTDQAGLSVQRPRERLQTSEMIGELAQRPLRRPPNTPRTIVAIRAGHRKAGLTGILLEPLPNKYSLPRK